MSVHAEIELVSGPVFSHVNRLKNNYMAKHYRSKGINPFTLKFMAEKEQLEKPYQVILNLEAFWYVRFLGWLPGIIALLYIGYDYSFGKSLYP